MVGENPTPYGILALWAVNSLSIVYWVLKALKEFESPGFGFGFDQFSKEWIWIWIGFKAMDDGRLKN